MRLYSLASLMMLCLSLTACANKFYIPICNQQGTAKPLSKTDDVIRVIVPDRYTKYVAKTRSNDPDWLKGSKLAFYIGMAKLNTEERLQNLGYQLTDTGLDGGDSGKSKKIEWIDSQGNERQAMTHGGKPTVYALVDSQVLDTYTQRFISEMPYSSDPGTGATTMWTDHVDEVVMNRIVYGIKLVRPIGKDNPLYQCNNSSLSTDFCTFPDSYWNDISHYETIFYGVGTMTTNARDSDYIENHLVSSVLYQYPNLLGKKRVIQISQPFFQVTKVTDIPK
ncbi:MULTISPECIES: hypothetical protein [unclassified Commensalibacter]|uniref:hypothetical protein n=1 Tax=unclassified Commensalibacter TaxID=2630218 RepID=UPI0018DBD405|nr:MULTISPECIES: hypothetical protein [unclassified Commensalibacter]MBH9970704.1 hypothetical protein [Commensalibacter sp. M0265]MBH9978059.1 hypothetical protein [Commensalibacter sp. M0266]MBH9993717.1 hypothetical protein [Commensalibacter sp. M0270]MBI0047237.1 hypothetical protein [Commensalibacter sp. M0267]MBI0056897.1 hypothetical protein [Commensalibacter sp. M0268]